METVCVLATDATKYSSAELEDIAYEFGDNHPVQCIIPVGVLVRACREYKNLKDSQDMATSYVRVVAAAEALMDAGMHEPGDFREEYLVLCREVDNLRNCSKNIVK